MRIVDLPELDGLPVIPGAVAVRRAAHGHFLAIGKKVLTPGGRYKGYHPRIAVLYRGDDGAKPGTGRYAIGASAAEMAQIDPKAEGLSFAAFALSPTSASWACKDGVDDSPCIPSKLGDDDERPVARVAVEAEPIDEKLGEVIR